MPGKSSGIRTWYRRLLSLYPTAYQEKFREPMLQTFDDCYQEHLAAQRGMPSFIIRTFADTGIGVFKEHLTAPMTTTPARLVAIVSLLLGGTIWLGLIGFFGYVYLGMRTGYDYSLGWHVIIFTFTATITLIFTFLSFLIKPGSAIRRMIVPLIVALIMVGSAEAYARIDEWQIRRTYADMCIPGAQFDVPNKLFPGHGLYCGEGEWGRHE